MAQIKQGASPHGLALSCSVGVACGIFPLLGLSTLFSLLIGIFIKLNQPVLQLVHYFMWPIQLLMIPVLLYLGESLFGMRHISVRPDILLAQFHQDMGGFFIRYGMAGLVAFLAWVLVSIPLIAALYFILKPIFFKLSIRFRPQI